jgi:hypothetical protein
MIQSIIKLLLVSVVFSLRTGGAAKKVSPSKLRLVPGTKLVSLGLGAMLAFLPTTIDAAVFSEPATPRSYIKYTIIYTIICVSN